MLREIGKNKIGHKQPERRKRWISETTWGLIQERNRLKRHQSDNLNLRAQYHEIAKAVKKSARNDKRNYLQNLANEAEAAAGANNMRELHKIIGQISNQYRNHNQLIKDEQGRLLTTTEEQTRRWKQHFESISNDNGVYEDNGYSEHNESEANISSINVDMPDINEIANAILKLKSNKSPGEDGIPPELLKTNPQVSAEILTPHIKKAWLTEQLPEEWTKGTVIKLPMKNDLTDCNNWRGITLLNTIYKILAIILNNRMQCVEQALSEEQAGFRPHRSCLDQTNTLRIVIEQSIEWRTPLYMVLIDFILKKRLIQLKKRLIQ
ncbi:uncharacterized protein LOC142235424 [Haematobia irritans]|uniref:uncharacterized protein LOC142235424 n=1 Tax=Haematobia irritans TaxID=7368 RepID=UPI003F4F9BF8